MSLTKKIINVTIPVFFVVMGFTAIVSGNNDGCVEADEFDVESLTVEAKPTNDGITGTYDPVNGGQNAEWHETGLKSNGDEFLIQVGGGWTTWNGNELSNTKLGAMSRCDFCAKKLSPLTPNCLCYKYTSDGITYSGTNTSGSGNDPNIRSIPTAEKGIDGVVQSIDCSTTANQNLPNSCSCTNDPTYGTALDYKTYHFPLNTQNKDEALKNPDLQSTCKYDRGMGLYIGLFGSRGTEVPSRLYHLFSTYEICNIKRNSSGKCLASDGSDMTRYIYTSPNKRIFLKDDHAGNDGTDTNTSDDEYHGPNEYVKFKIYDNYYGDNFGKYQISILRGVGRANGYDDGLLEFLVSLVEDTMLGEVDANGDRQGGIIQFMYQSIVQDTNFIRVVQISLGLYIALFGAAHMFGLTEWSKQEVMSRILKIALIIFFTSPTSWYFYNKIIVGFFKDSMDYVVAMMMSLSDSNIDPTSMTVISQMDRAANTSNATRFSYIDVMIKKLLSVATAKKVFGLFFGTYYGILLIPATYAVIAYFIYVMLWAAVAYTINIMKIIFVLALGPIFICFTLFSHTASMFKSWLGYLGGRSFEIIMLFSVLYSFVTLIDQNFTDLLSFRTCVKNYNLAIFTLKILVSDIGGRSLMQWLTMYVMIAGLIFIMRLIMDKIPDISSALFSVNISGAKVRSDGSTGGGAVASHGSGAAGIMGAVKDVAMAAASGAFNAAGYATGKGMEMGRSAMRASGAAQALGNMMSGFPISSPATMYNNMKIDSAISSAQKEATSMGLSGKEADAHVRQAANNILQNQMLPKDLNDPKVSNSIPSEFAITGLDSQAIQARFEQKMVQQPLKDFLKAEAQKLKNQDPDKIPLGKDMRNQLRANAMAWADKNLVGGSSAVEKYLGKEGRDAGKAGGSAFAVAARDINNVLKSSAELSTAEAAKRFAGSPSLQNKFLQHLQEKEFKRNLRNSEAQSPISSLPKAETALGKTANAMRTSVDVAANVLGKKVPNLASRALDGVMRTEARNPKMAQQSFLRNVRNEERWDSGSAAQKALVLNPFNRSNTLDRGMNVMNIFGGKASSLSERTDAARTAALVSTLKGDAKLEKVTPKTDLPKDIRAAEKKNEKDAKKREFFQSQLRENATKGLAKDVSQIERLEILDRAEEAKKIKEKMLQEARSGIELKDGKITAKDGQTLFEAAAKLDYLHRKFGLEGESPQKAILEALKADAAINATRAEEAIASAKTPADLAQAKIDAKNLADLKSGLFGSEIQITNAKASEANPDSKAMNEKREKAMKDLKKSLEVKPAAKSKIGAGSDQEKDKKEDAKNDKDINKEKAETQDRSDKINKALLEKEEALKKEAKEKEAKEKEAKEKEAKEKEAKEKEAKEKEAKEKEVKEKEAKEKEAKEKEDKEKKAKEKEAKEKEAKEKEIKELRENATKDLVKDVAQIEKLEKQNKDEEAKEAKEKMLREALSVIELKDDKITAKGGQTLFEAVVKLDYLHRKFGLEGESPQKAILEVLQADAAISVKRVEEAIALAKNPNDLDEAKKDAKNLADLKTGLFGSELQITNAKASELNPASKAMNERRDKAMENLKKSLEVKPVAKSKIGAGSGQEKEKDKKQDAKNDKDISEEKAESQVRSDQINKSLFEKEEALKKEESERADKAKKEAKEKEGRDKFLDDVIGKMAEIQKIEKEIADEKGVKVGNETSGAIPDPNAANQTSQEKSKASSQNDPKLSDEKEKALTEAKQQLQEMLSDKPASEVLKVINGEIESKVEVIEQKMQTLAKENENKIADVKAKKDDALLQEVLKEVKVEANGFIAKTMKIEFGASISDLFLKDPDIGLHAGNILLGIPDGDNKVDKSAQINSTKTLLNMAEGKLKIQTINKKMKEFEISQLEKLKTAGGQVDDKEIDKLKAEVSELEDQLFQSQNSVKKVEAEMTNLKDG